MTDPAIHVSDRALLRYLERGFDLDIEALRLGRWHLFDPVLCGDMTGLAVLGLW